MPFGIIYPSRWHWADVMLPLQGVVASLFVMAEGHIYTNPTAAPWDGQRPHAEWHLCALKGQHKTMSKDNPRCNQRHILLETSGIRL